MIEEDGKLDILISNAAVNPTFGPMLGEFSVVIAQSRMTIRDPTFSIQKLMQQIDIVRQISKGLQIKVQKSGSAHIRCRRGRVLNFLGFKTFSAFFWPLEAVKYPLAIHHSNCHKNSGG